MSCHCYLGDGKECGQPVAKSTPFCLNHGLIARLEVLHNLNAKKGGKQLHYLSGFQHCHRCYEPCGPLELCRCKKHRTTLPSDEECLAYLAELETETTIKSCQHISIHVDGSWGAVCTTPALPNGFYCENHLNEPHQFDPIPLEMRRPVKETKSQEVDIAGNQADFTVRYQNKIPLTNKAILQYNCTFFRDLQESDVEIKQDFGRCVEGFLRKLHNSWMTLGLDDAKEIIDVWFLKDRRATDQAPWLLEAITKMVIYGIVDKNIGDLIPERAMPDILTTLPKVAVCK